MAEKDENIVDKNLREKFDKMYLKENDYNYQYKLHPSGSKDFTTKLGKSILSKNNRKENCYPDFLLFYGLTKRTYNQNIVIIEDKDNTNMIGNFKIDIPKVSQEEPYKYALSDGFHYAYELLTKTKEVKHVLVIGNAGRQCKAKAFYLYQSNTINDNHSKLNKEKISKNISMIEIGDFPDWNIFNTKNNKQRGRKIIRHNGKRFVSPFAYKVHKYIMGHVLGLSREYTSLNLSYLRTKSSQLSKFIDNKLQLNPYQRLLLISGLLIGLNDDPNLIYNFNGPNGASYLDDAIDGGLPNSKFSRDKKDQLMNSFNFIRNDPVFQNELPTKSKSSKSKGYPLDYICKHYLLKRFPITKQSIFSLMTSGTHFDLLGNLFDIFTKYMDVGGSQGDIVLTPSHLTNLMAQLINVNYKDVVLDITAGSAGFLIAALKQMKESIDKKKDLSIKAKQDRIQHIKEEQLWGVEYNSDMYAVAVTNMLLHGDGKSHIFRGDSLKGIDLTSRNQLKDELTAKYSKLLINPPYHDQALFTLNGLKYLKDNGLGAIIMPKTTFATAPHKITDDIFKNNKLECVIDLPNGQFKTKNKTIGSAVSIYIFRHGIKHDFQNDFVTFIRIKEDKVYSRGNHRGIASKTTLRIYKDLINYVRSNYKNTSAINNDHYFDKIINTKIKPYKIMYSDYIKHKIALPSKRIKYNVAQDFMNYLEKGGFLSQN